MTPEELHNARPQLDAIREPFPPEQINQIRRGNTEIDYVGHAELTNRLLELDPLWNWEPFAVDDNGLPKIVSRGNVAELWVRLTFAGVTRIGVGTCSVNKNEVSKELIGDALRNAAMRFGAALDLWAKSDLRSQQEPVPSFIDADQQDQIRLVFAQIGDDTARHAAQEAWKQMTGWQALYAVPAESFDTAYAAAMDAAEADMSWQQPAQPEGDET